MWTLVVGLVGVILGGSATLFVARFNATAQYTKWLQEKRLEAYTEALQLLSDQENVEFEYATAFANAGKQHTSENSAIAQKMVPLMRSYSTMRLRIQILGPNEVFEAADKLKYRRNVRSKGGMTTLYASQQVAESYGADIQALVNAASKVINEGKEDTGPDLLARTGKKFCSLRETLKTIGRSLKHVWSWINS